MATRPVLTGPSAAYSNDAQNLAKQAGVTQDDLLKQNGDQNPDTLVGGAAMNQRGSSGNPVVNPFAAGGTAAPATAAPSAAPTGISEDEARKQWAANGNNATGWTKNADGTWSNGGNNPGGVARPILDGSTNGGTSDASTDVAKPRSQEEIRQDQLRQAQAMIDATEATFQDQLAGIRSRGVADLNQTSSIAVGAGLAGSPFQQAQEKKTTNATATEEKAAQNQRTAEISKIQAAALDRATDVYDKEIARYQTDRQFAADEKARSNADAAAKTTAARLAASETIKNLAKSGIALSEIDPAQYQKMLRDGNMTEFEANALYTASNPQLNGTTEVSNGYVVNYYIDPKTGKPVITKEALPKELAGANEADLQHVTLADGEYVYDSKNLNADGTPKLFKLGGKKAGDGDQPITKEINGKTMQYNTATGKWEEPSVEGGNQPNTAAVDALTQKAGLIDELLANWGGMTGAVGIDAFNPFGDDRTGGLGLRGERANFIAGVQQLVSADTLDALINLKKAGGTLGALSDGERQTLQEAAGKIGTWAIRDKAGNVTGYKAAENDFKKELQRIKTITDKALAEARGTGQQGAGGGDGDGAEIIEKDGVKYHDDGTGNWVPIPKTSAGSDAKSAQNMTGSLSEKYESGGNPGAIGYDGTGGFSYGKYQLAHNNAKSFVDQSPYAKDFAGLTFNSKAWQDKWKQVAAKDPQGFGEAQRGYIEKTHYAPQVARIEQATGRKVAELPQAVQDVIWSTAVQHGSATNIVVDAMKKVGPNASPAQLIDAIYARRWNGGKSFASSTPAVRAAVYNRFFGKGGEKARALAMLDSNLA